MDLRLVKEILYFKYTKDIPNDFQSTLRINFDLFFNQNKECSLDLFDFFLFCIFVLKMKKNICLNKNIIILNQDYLNNSETVVLNDNKLFLNKIFIIPILNHSGDKVFNIIKKIISKRRKQYRDKDYIIK